MLPTIGAGGAGAGVWAGVGGCALAPPITPRAITTSPSKSMRTTMSMAAPPPMLPQAPEAREKGRSPSSSMIRHSLADTGSEKLHRIPGMETAHVKVEALGGISKERLHFEVAGFYGELANHTGRTFTHTAPHALQPSRARYSSRL